VALTACSTCAVSRKWNEMESFVSSIALLMVDEIHFIADEERGATLEATVCRMKSISAWKQQQVSARFFPATPPTLKLSWSPPWLSRCALLPAWGCAF